MDREGSMSDEDKLTKWASLVPEIYYDLIARVPPGTFLVVALMWVLGIFSNNGAFELKDIKDMSWAPTTASLFLLLGTGYVVGIILTPLGGIIGRTYWLHLWQKIGPHYNKWIVEFNNLFGADLPIDEDSNIQWHKLKRVHAHRLSRQLQEYVKDKNDQAKLILPKMSAESALCSNTVGGIVILQFSLIVRMVQNHEIMTEKLGVLLFITFVGLLSFWASYYRSSRHIHRACSLLSMVNYQYRRA
jgi:hypothetical protein